MRMFLTVAVAMVVGMQSVGAAEAPDTVKKLIETWRVAWNTGEAKAMKPVFHKDAIFLRILENMPARVNKRFTERATFYGTITAIKVTAYFPKANRCLALADFDKLKGFPIVFELKADGPGFLVADETFGIDPTEKRSDAAIEAFAKQWTAAVNSGTWKALRETFHSKSDLLQEILLSKQPEAEVATMFMGFLKSMGPIKSHAVKGYRKNTSEYIVAFEYATKGTVSATIILKKDVDGKLRCSRMDIDDGARALKDMDSWTPK